MLFRIIVQYLLKFALEIQNYRSTPLEIYCMLCPDKKVDPIIFAMALSILTNIDNIWQKSSLVNLHYNFLQNATTPVICVIAIPCKNGPCSTVFLLLM